MRKVEQHAARDGSTTYKVRFRYRGKQTSETFDSLREAREFAHWLEGSGPTEALQRLFEKAQQDAVPTLNELAVDHIEHLTGVTDGTRKTYTRLWQRTWGPRIGHLPANRIVRDDIAKAVNDLGRTYSHKSLENQRGLLAGVLARAVELEHLAKNPAKGMRLPRGKEAERVDMRIITPDEFAVVIEKVPEHYRSLVRFLFGTGCRWGEAVALTVGDIALPNVRIRRALKWSPDNLREVGPTKTKKSNRTIVVGGEMLDDLDRACAGKARGDLVFTAPRGGQVLHRTFWSRVWLPAVDHLEPRPRIHDLRHSHASWLLGQGVPIHVVQARLGHESIQTTVDTYSKLLPDAQLMASEAAALAFRPRAIEG